MVKDVIQKACKTKFHNCNSIKNVLRQSILQVICENYMEASQSKCINPNDI